MNSKARLAGILAIVAGSVLVIAGGVTYYTVHSQLADEKIFVSGDADFLAGNDVDGPFSAYAEATVIKKHADGIADGKTYAELGKDDPKRQTVMTASFLRASLFTSVVAFGVAALVVGLGVLFIIVGFAIVQLAKRPSNEQDESVAGPAPDPAPEPVAAT
jgi:hypothetical protein